jgi:hypothetical protein
MARAKRQPAEFDRKNKKVPKMGTFLLTNLWEPIKLCM